MVTERFGTLKSCENAAAIIQGDPARAKVIGQWFEGVIIGRRFCFELNGEAVSMLVEELTEIKRKKF